MFENLPQELKLDALWCCWKLTDKGKVPYDAVTGKLAKSNDRNTFNNYRDTLQYLGNYLKVDENGKFTGGLGLGIFNGFSAIDIDHCVDENGVVSDMAKEIIDYCQSYTEYSPSKTGIRIIFKTDYKNFDKKRYYTNNHKNGLEIYIEGATNKFVTVTGNSVLAGIGVNKVDIEYVLNKYMLKPEQTVSNDNHIGVNTYDIKNFIDKDAKLYQLWNSMAGGSGTGESETDLALCSKLAFYLQRDPEAINKAFMESPYFNSKDMQHQSKWVMREDYRKNTIGLAIQGCSSVYTPQVVQETKVNYGLNDTGNAHRFVDQFGSDIHYNVDNNKWMIWNGANWQTDIYGTIKNYAEILIEQMMQEAYLINDLKEQQEVLKNINKLFNTSGKENMLKEAQHLSGIPVCNDNFDKDDFLLNCRNCVIDLRSGNALPHNKNLLLNKIANAEYSKENNKPKRFLQFLNEVYEGNQEIIHYIQKAFGYSLTGDCMEQVAFFLTGDGSNGKSVLMQVLSEILGDYSCTSDAKLIVDTRYQNANMSAVAKLKGIRLVNINEMEMGDRLNESKFKELVSGNTNVVARFLYGNEFEFPIKAKMWSTSNYRLKIRGTDNGVWRRYVEIPHTKTFNGDEIDMHLIDKLRLEYDAILAWGVEGCLMWQQEGLDMPECLQQVKDAYRVENDVIQQWINECCEEGLQYKERSSILFESYKAYCQKYNEYIMSNTLWGKNFSKKHAKKNDGKGIVYLGIRIKGIDNI